jgi:hypothetical protein
VRRALFDSGLRQKKQALALAKPDFSSLPEVENLLLAAQKQLLELPYVWYSVYHTKFVKMRFIPVLLRIFPLFR